jgi:uncharacterized protein (DUF1697 family)
MPPASTTYVALLRAINIGSHNRIAMPELRALCESLGWNDVRSYIQSGNVVFRDSAPAARLEARLEQAIDRLLGLSVPVVIRSAAAWADYTGGNPFADAAQADPKRLMLALSKSPPDPDAAEALRARATGGERIEQRGDALWIYFDNSVARSKLSPTLLDRLVGSPVTMRNWRTVMELARMVGVEIPSVS